MKQYIFKIVICIFLIGGQNIFSQENKSFDPNYKLLKSNYIEQDKIFYVLTAMQQDSVTKQILITDKTFVKFIEAKKKEIIKSAENCGENSECHFDTFLWKEEEVKFISKRLRKLFKSKNEIRKFIQNHIKPSGYYQNYANLSDEEILIKAWEDASKGVNHLINVYGKGIKPMYAKIDSIRYDKNSTFYKRLIDINTNSIANDLKTMNLFFEPSLQFAINLLDCNDRDEISSYEPIEKKENKATFERITTIDWDKFKYSIILVPGYGPEEEKTPLSPVAKFRLKLAAERYHSKLAPIIVVSGGRVHPFRTPYNEAFEMKKFLMDRYQIPENAILIEPFARHTTTNFRNAARLIYRYGIPSTKKALVTTTKYQSYYITDMALDKRCVRELGYIPYKLVQRLNQNDIEFLPIIKSLHRNFMDPLDP